MSVPFTSQTPLIRLSSATITVKHGTLNANVKFNTNLPIGSGMLIRKVSFVVAPLDTTPAGKNAVYLTSQLSENTSLTATSLSDPLAIASYADYYSHGEVTAASYDNINIEEIQSGSETFGGLGVFTGAQLLNLIASMTEITGAGFVNGFNFAVYVWFQIAVLDAQLQNYVNNRLALQR